jgi:hypothetical protein
LSGLAGFVGEVAMKWFGFTLAIVVALWASWFFGVLGALETLINDWFYIISAR